MENWNLEDPIDCFIMGLLVADGYVLAETLGGGIDMCDESLVRLVADRFGAPVRMRNRKSNHRDAWRDQFVAQWSSGQPGGYRPRKPQPSWLELVDLGIMRPNKKYTGLNVDVMLEWSHQSRMWFHAGFVEGDGHVRRHQVVLENHASMLSYHEIFRADTGATGRTNNRGHVISNICRRENRQKFLDATSELAVVSGKIASIRDHLATEPGTGSRTRKPVRVGSELFPSIKTAAEHLGVKTETLVRWINDKEKEVWWAT